MESPSSPQAGTSSATSDTFSIDICRIVGENEAPRLTKLLKINKLKLVPIHWIGIDPTELSRNEEKCKKLESEVAAQRASLISCKNALQSSNGKLQEKQVQASFLQEEVNKFETLLAVRKRRLEQTEIKCVGVEVISDLFQEVIMNLLDDGDKTKLKIGRLRNDFQRAKKKLRAEGSQRIAKYEKTVKILRSQLKQAKNLISESNTAKEKLNLQNAQLSRKLAEDTEKLKASFQIERSRRLHEIIALKDEKERMTVCQCSFMGFIRQLKECSGFSAQNDDDEMISTNYLERLLKHVNTMLQRKNEETSELIRNRELMQQMEVLFLRARQSEIPLPEMVITGENNRSIVNRENKPLIHTEKCSFPQRSDSIVGNNEAASQSQSIANFSPVITSVSSLVGVTQPQPQLSTEPEETKPSYAPVQEKSIVGETTSQNVKVDPYDINAEFEAKASPSKIPIFKSIRSSCPPGSSSPQKPVVNGNKNKASRSKPSSRNDKQFAPYTTTRKAHGVNKASAQFRCLCGNVYANEKGLNVHIRKMTTEWKYKCTTCLQYFFHQSELGKHVNTSRCKASREGVTAANSVSAEVLKNAKDRQINSFLQDLLSSPQRQQQPTKIMRCNKPISQSQNLEKRNVNKRLLQQKFLKGKQHVAWLSKMGAIQGFWYCKCGSKFSYRKHLQTHIYYFTLEWRFKCPQGHCQEKFYSLSYLKSHMKKIHKIANPLNKYSTGCNFCGKMFISRTDLYKHRKTVHNLHKSSFEVKVGKSRSASSQETPSQQITTSIQSEASSQSQSSEPVIVLPSPPPVKTVECIDLTFEDDDDHGIVTLSTGKY